MNDIISEGLRRFYGAHRWSFLNVTTTLSTVAGTQTYTLPDDYAWLASQGFTNTTAMSAGPTRIAIVEYEAIQSLYAPSTQTGSPYYAAIYPGAATTLTAGQRWTVRLFPQPDAVYALAYRYRKNPDLLTTALPYALGGMQHSGAINASCLAVAEERIQDTQGVNKASYMELLANSIRLDGYANLPLTLGVDRRDYAGDEYTGIDIARPITITNNL
jgi:hypothetical protein